MSIYWCKSEACLADKGPIMNADWSAYKRQIASDIVETLVSNQARYMTDLLRLMYDVAETWLLA